jgi:Fur family ferric uptake transcriptional regulator
LGKIESGLSNVKRLIFGMNYRTRQREAVLQVLSHGDKPLTAQAVFAKANAIYPGIGVVTVFRTLKEAMQSGEISKVELQELLPHYEKYCDSHHDFFVCQACQDVQPLQGCVKGLSKLLPKSCRMKDHEVVIFASGAICRATLP